MDNAFIKKLGNFTRLSRDDKALLARVTAERVRHVGAREDIVRDGTKPAAINVILSGWAARYKFLEDGRRQIMSFFMPGDMCDLNIFVLRQMDHTIGALTPVTVAEITRPVFDSLMHASVRITQTLWWEGLVAAAVQREWAMNLGQRDAYERTAHLFCELFLRLRAIGQTVGNACELPVTQSDLGDATGLSSVHVNRTLQALRQAKLITLKGKVLTVVRRQGFWDKWRAGLAEALAHLGCQFRRPPCGEASAAG